MHYSLALTSSEESVQPTQEFLDSAEVEDYYPEKPIAELPAGTKFEFSKEKNILIQPGASRTKMYSDGLSCEVISEQTNTAQLRIALPKTVKSVAIVPYSDDRVCIESKIPIPEKLDADDLKKACQLEGHHIIKMTGKCFKQIKENDGGNPLWTTSVLSKSSNPRLFAIPNLYARLETACRAKTQTIEVSFEGGLRMACYDSWGFTNISEFVKNVEKAFNIKIKVPVPGNLKDVELKGARPSTISI